MKFLADVLAGGITGIITGFGIGGGTLLIIWLTMFGDMSQASAQGINLLYFIPTAGSALVSHIKNKRVNWKVMIFSSGAGVVVTVFAALVATRLDTELLRRVFGAFLIAIGILELFGRKNDNKE